VVECAVRAEVEGGESAAVGLGDDQGALVGGDRHPVGEGQVVGDDTGHSLRRDQGDEAGCGFATGEVEADAVDVGVAVAVDDDVVPWLVGDRREVGVRGHRADGIAAQQLTTCRVQHEQLTVRQEVDAHREGLDANHHLMATLPVEDYHLVRAPVGEPEPACVPAGRLTEDDALHQHGHAMKTATAVRTHRR
jgi:hypothetical protein